jgi:hypothetical protein
MSLITLSGFCVMTNLKLRSQNLPITDFLKGAASRFSALTGDATNALLDLISKKHGHV